LADIQRRTTDRRHFLTAWTILWGNRYFHAKAGLALSADGNGYTVRNAQYAAALLDALAEQLNVGVDPKEALQRANSILLHLVRADSFLKRHTGLQARPITPGSGANELLGVIAYLTHNFGRLGLNGDLEPPLRQAADRLLRLHLDRMQRISRPLPAGARSPVANMTVEEWVQAVERTLGRPFNWTDLIVIDVADLIPYPFPWPFPVPAPCTLKECEQTPCLVDGYIPAQFFTGSRKDHVPGRPPVVFVGGWEVQCIVQTGSGAFGNERSFATLEPSSSPPWNNTDQEIPPPFFQMEIQLPQEREFHGLGTMLRCAAAYDYVAWGQSHPGGPIQDSVNELRKVIDATKQLYGVHEVILVCHSRGGLIARKCILDYWQQHQAIDVARLITYGTPHLGAALATLGEDILAELIPGVLLAVLFGSPGLASLPATILDTIGTLFGSQAEQSLEDQILQLVTPLFSPECPNFAGFVASAEEMKPDSAFILSLNQGYSSANVVSGGKNLGNLWQAIPTVLVAGTSPDFLTVYLGSWLADISLAGWLAAQAPQLCSRTISVLGASFDIYYPCYKWRWHWHPLARVFSDITPLIPELAALDTFKEGKGDAVVERTSALAEGVTGVRRVEFHLEHFNLKANNDQQATFDTPEGQFSGYPWQLMFAELGLPLGNMLSGCNPTQCGCQDFVMSQSFG
jgi:pimeloyl-ACP methyl ester carboxylesterase